jgi:hypothetical protein
MTASFTKFAVGLVVIAGLGACGGSSSGTTGDSSSGSSGTTDGTSTGAGTNGGSTSGSNGGSTGGGGGLTVTQCQNDANKFAGAGCSDASDYTTASSSTCPKITNASSALCSDALARAATSYDQFQNSTVACNSFGITDSNDPSAVDALYAIYCVATMNSVRCAGQACQFNSDCPTNFTCNDKTGKCADDSAPCIGLPCTYNQDCPTGLTCNNALGQCTKQ